MSRKNAALMAALCALTAPGSVYASDHDDGESDTKVRNKNLTELLAFKESWQTGNPNHNNLVLVMNTNSRAQPGYAYQFNTFVNYNFHIAKGSEVMTVSFRFGHPDSNGSQGYRMTTSYNYGRVGMSRTGFTVPFKSSALGWFLYNDIPGYKIFAGMREDTFFFDVDAYFRTRQVAADFYYSGATPDAGNFFRSPAQACDFTKGLNVSSIVASIPQSELPGGGSDELQIWETITQTPTEGVSSYLVSIGRFFDLAERLFNVGDLAQRLLGKPVQIERLARPAINEGLHIANADLNLSNSVEPGVESIGLNAVIDPLTATPGQKLVLRSEEVIAAFYGATRGFMARDSAPADDLDAAVILMRTLNAVGTQLGVDFKIDGASNNGVSCRIVFSKSCAAKNWGRLVARGFLYPDVMKINLSNEVGSGNAYGHEPTLFKQDLFDKISVILGTLTDAQKRAVFGTLVDASNFKYRVMAAVRLATIALKGLTSGRKITDDVMDTTLQAASANFGVSDGVSYSGSGNPCQGHQAPISAFPYVPHPYAGLAD